MVLCVSKGHYLEGGTGIMLKRYTELIENFSEANAAKIFALQVGVRFYPILKMEGFGLQAPLGVVVENDEMIEPIVRELCGFAEPRMISLCERRKEFANKIREIEYELVAVLCKMPSQNNRENASFLNDIMVSGYGDKRVFRKLPMIFFIGGVPLEMADYLAGKIVFEGTRKGGRSEFQVEENKKMIQLFSDYLPCIQEKFDGIMNDKNRGNVFLEACREIALIFLNLEAKKSEEQRVIRMFGIYVDAINNAWNIKIDYSDWIEKLRELILKEGKNLTVAEDRTKASDGNQNYMLTEKKLFFDEKYYYITESMFALACSKLSYYVGTCEMKNALAEAGILVGEGINRKYFSVKLPISTPEGIKVIGRRMRILREWIDRPGELSWAEQITSRRGQE